MHLLGEERRVLAGIGGGIVGVGGWGCVECLGDGSCCVFCLRWGEQELSQRQGGAAVSLFQCREVNICILLE